MEEEEEEEGDAEPENSGEEDGEEEGDTDTEESAHTAVQAFAGRWKAGETVDIHVAPDGSVMRSRSARGYIPYIV